MAAERWRIALVFDVDALTADDAYVQGDEIAQQVEPTDSNGDPTLAEIVVEPYRINRL